MAADAPALERRLLERLGGFGDFVRRRGVPLGMGAELDFAAATRRLAPLDRSDWRAAAAVTLAKSPEEVATVTAAFDLFFSEDAGAPSAPAPAGEMRLLGRSRRGPAQARSDPRRSRREEPVPVAVPLGTYSITAPLVPHAIVPLDDRAFRRLRRGARRFRRDVATLPGRRRTRAHYGQVDIADTIRHSVHQGGEWVELRRTRPRLLRAELVVLWDVSGSMREHESRFFGLVSALESVSRSGRVFAFSTKVEEITGEVRRFGYRRATAEVGGRVDQTDGGTRIGHSLEEFEARFGSILRKQTTLVILSDGWDLGEGELVADLLARLRPRVARIVWVTPYTRRPGFEPRVGALEAALPFVDELLGPEDFESRWRLRPFSR